MKLILRIDSRDDTAQPFQSQRDDMSTEGEDGNPLSPAPQKPDDGDLSVPPDAWSAFEPVLEEELLNLAPDLAECESAEISVSLVTPEDIRTINRDYRECDEVTDVLSFPMWEEDGKFVPDTESPVLTLGDIVMCMPEIRARSEGMTDLEALCLMTAHSFLHLLAWDHDTDERRDAMWARQDAIKTRLLAALAQPLQPQRAAQPLQPQRAAQPLQPQRAEAC